MRQSVQAFNSIHGTEATCCPLRLRFHNRSVNFEEAFTAVNDLECSNTWNYVLSQVPLYVPASLNDLFSKALPYIYLAASVLLSPPM